jgi:hypothetical protein
MRCDARRLTFGERPACGPELEVEFADFVDAHGLGQWRDPLGMMTIRPQRQRQMRNSAPHFLGHVGGGFQDGFVTASPFRSLTPGSPPFVNSTPAASRAVRMAWIASSETARRDRSKSTTVESPSEALEASSA